MQKSKAVTEWKILQENIIKLYCDLIILSRQQLCNQCHFWKVDPHITTTDQPVCSHNLLPITSEGEQCPYFVHE